MSWIVDFADGSREMRDLLGGKGAGVAEMTRVLGAERVPAGFTITTEACVAYLRDGRPPEDLEAEVDAALAGSRRRRASGLETPTTRCWSRFAREPGSRCRACSTRCSTSGSPTRRWPDSRSRPATRALPGIPTGAWCRCSATSCADSRGRVRGRAAQARDRGRGRARHRPRAGDAARAHRELFEQIIAEAGDPFPQDPRDQLREAIAAVFESWNGDRARAYRRLERIPEDWGTAVNVQQMVFGNRGERPRARGSPSPATRPPARREPSGDFLANAQGEDVVAGVRNTAEPRRVRRTACPRRTPSCSRC